MNFLSKNQNERTISSREIAELTGKLHKNVIQDCEKLNSNYRNLSMAEISAVDYKANNGQTYKELHLTKIQCMDLMTGYNLDLRIKVNRRWEELEKVNTLDFNDPNTIALLAQNYANEFNLRVATERKLIEKEKQVFQSELLNKRLQTTIMDQEPKVVFAEAVISAETDIQIGQLAKVISQATGKSIGQNKLFSILRDNGYLLSRGEQYNLPAQQYIDRGIFKIKYSTYNDSLNNKKRINATCMVTPQGQEYFVNKFVRKFKN